MYIPELLKITNQEAQIILRKYLFMFREGERKREQREGKRKREIENQAGSILSSEPNMGARSPDPEVRTCT